MSRIKKLFEKKQGKILNVYCTAGFPQLHSTMDVIKALQENGADIIELGMPYSDPLADGPVIQHSSSVALAMEWRLKYFWAVKWFEKKPFTWRSWGSPFLLSWWAIWTRCCSMALNNFVRMPLLQDWWPDFTWPSRIWIWNGYGTIIKKYGLDFIFLVTPRNLRRTGEKTWQPEQRFFICSVFFIHHRQVRKTPAVWRTTCKDWKASPLKPGTGRLRDKRQSFIWCRLSAGKWGHYWHSLY